ALWRFAFKVQPDWVIDMHEGYEFNRSHKPPAGKKKSVGSSIIYDESPEMNDLAKRVVAAADQHVPDSANAFVLIPRGPVSTGIARVCISVMGAEGVILETTYKDQPISRRTRQHRAMANVLLNEIGLIDQDCSQMLAVSRADQMHVAVYDSVGVGESHLAVCEIVEQSDSMVLHHIGADEVSHAVLSQFDTVVFPGGSGSKQAEHIGESGRAAVQRFVRDGGGYLGVCAGAYLCSSHYSWSLDLIDSAVFTGTAEVPGKGKMQLWHRGGKTPIEVELTDLGLQLYGAPGISKKFEVIYANGPIISAHESDALADYEVLAWFRSENAKFDQQKGTMIDTPAIVRGNFGKGRVISMSPHPELTPALNGMIEQSVEWLARQ
ncbi:MAG: BPL-N domain-containing protein, partial [Verrucomicrobiota bacterium]